MRKTPLLFAESSDPYRGANGTADVSVSELQRRADDWLFECDFRQVSPATIAKYRIIKDNLIWFLNDGGHADCGRRELQAFFLYLRNGHGDPRGRWGNPQNNRPVRPGTTATYFTVLRTLFRYLVAEGVVPSSPMESMPRPIDRPDQVQPFTRDQIDALRAAARRSRHPRRDEAIVLFLYDTGVRASELCGLRLHDLDFQSRRCTVQGKGNKRRAVYFGKDTARVLWQYLKEDARERDIDGALFLADRGAGSGSPLTRNGLLQLIERLGKAARIDATRCSPHRFRHSFAVEFLRGGGNVFSLKELLGHSSLTIVNRYVALAQADIANQHRMYSPVDRLKGDRRSE